MDAVVKAGTSVILVKDRRVLIGIRLGSHAEGYWAFPGGSIEPTKDSDLRATGEREVKEETGIVCRVYKPDGVRDELFTTSNITNDDGSTVYMTAFLIGEYVSGGEWLDNDTIKGAEPNKCEKWHWVTVPDLIRLITTSKQKTWVPVDTVARYLMSMGVA